MKTSTHDVGDTSRSPPHSRRGCRPGDPLELLLARYALGYSRQRQHGS